MNILLLLLDAGAQQAQQGQPKPFGGLWMILLLFVIMWLLMIRPQRKKAKEEAEMRNKLQKGDRVLFSGGIYGKVHSVADSTVEVEISNGVIVTVEKQFVQAVTTNTDNAEEKK